MTRLTDENAVVVVKGAGDLGSGVILRLHRAGFRLLVTELAEPTSLRRTVAFSESVYCGEVQVEGVWARHVNRDGVRNAWEDGIIPVLVDPCCEIGKALAPLVLVDCTMAKCNLGTRLDDAAVVIGVGPGFVVGGDVHAVIETKRGHELGRVLWHGSAMPDTGVPGEIGGHTVKRLLRAPCTGIFQGAKQIGDVVHSSEVAGWVDDQPVIAEISGVLRGLLRDGLKVKPLMKIGDIDPRGTREHCFMVSDKSLAIGGGVLEAVLYLLRRLPTVPAHG